MKIGFATIGESPRDDLVPYLVSRLSRPARVLEGGVLDGLDEREIAALDEGGEELHMVTRRRDGGSARLAYRQALPRMQRVVDDLVAQGAELVVILCGADWSAVRAPVPLVNPGVLFPNVVQALAQGKRLGVVKPSDGQVARTETQYRELGLEPCVTAAFPYDERALERADAAGAWLAEREVDMVWMTCVGMGEEMREALRARVDRPVILARSLLARVIDELAA